MSVDGLVDHLFRHSAGQMVAVLTRTVGADRLEEAEEAVQDALVRALEVWPYRGVPSNPRGWLFRVARNRLLDTLRRDATLARKLEGLHVDEPGSGLEEEARDDELAMILMCCHPALSREAQVALTLKTVGGFSVPEIAAALLAEPAAVAQRLVRAKRLLAERGIRMELPTPGEVVERLDAVLDVVYLMFNEGHDAAAGDALVRRELCMEAIRLARLLTRDARTAEPRVHALLALLLLHASRLPARTDGAGDLLLLDEQDRSLWDRALIAEGMRHLDRSCAGEVVTPFHVQAAIAATHAAAPHASATDWPLILRLYDQLIELTPSPVVALNRAVAVARVHGPDAGVAEMERLESVPALRRYFLYPAVRAGLLRDAGRTRDAERWYTRALELPANAAQLRYVQRQLHPASLPAVAPQRHNAPTP